MTTHDGAWLDADAVAQCVAGSGDALARLYERHGPACLSLARSILVDQHYAEDAVQEAFLHLWRHAEHFDASRSTARSWLLLLTRCRSVDRVRAEQRRKTCALSPQDDRPDLRPGPSQQTVTAMLAAEAVGALATLSPAKREALVLAYWGGYTQREIAEMTRTPLGTVKTRTRDALRSLADELADSGGPSRQVQLA